MKLQHILVATDPSEAGRAAVHAGLIMANAAQARLTVMTAALADRAATVAAGGGWSEGIDSLEELAAHVRSEAGTPTVPAGVELDLVTGLPGIEVPRYAEQHGADLVVLGRKPRTAAARLVMGDTADAVARRSRVPCLMVPGRTEPPKRVLVALDGTLRGEVVLETAADFVRQAGGELGVVIVERSHPGEPDNLARQLPAARSERVRELVAAAANRLGARIEVDVRRGDPVEQILAALDGWDMLAIGYHRGGPAGIIEGGSIARQLVHAAPGSLLTVPL